MKRDRQIADAHSLGIENGGRHADTRGYGKPGRRGRQKVIGIGRACGRGAPAEQAGDRLQYQVRRRVLLPMPENFAGLGQGHPIDHGVGVAAAGGECAVDGAELLPERPSGLATGAPSPGATSLG